nr:NAD(P)-dependent oxidoreductase [uncultured Actinoplanes sp.]
MTTTIAVLGTGIMGSAMARNLAKAGFEVRAWNRTREHAEPLTADGIRVTGTAAEAVDGASVVVTMLYDGAAVRDVIGQASPRPGTIWLQTTTASLTDVAGLAAYARERDLVFYDAPVLGTRQPAEAGQLVVLAAGPAGQRPALEPVLEAIGSRTIWLGEDGAGGGGTRLKLVANSWVLAVTNGAAEVLAFAQALGVDPDDFFDAIAGGPLDMPYLHVKTDLIRQDKLSPASFAVDTAEKDARLIVEAGRNHGVRLDVAQAGADRLRRASRKGRGDNDLAASYYASFDD